MNDGYCGTCYSEARREGRTVTLTQWSKYPLCGVCVQHASNGLVHNRPSNGTEFMIFEEQCYRCRHYIDDRDNPKPGRMTPPFSACAWGVLDRFLVQVGESNSHASNWFDPDDLDPSTCPATCKRFTPKGYEGDDMDPPKPDVPGQLMLGEAYIPMEVAPERKIGAASC